MFVGVGFTENWKTQNLNMPTASGEGRRQNCRRPAKDWVPENPNLVHLRQKSKCPLAVGKLRSVGDLPAPRLNRGTHTHACTLSPVRLPARLRADLCRLAGLVR